MNAEANVVGMLVRDPSLFDEALATGMGPRDFLDANLATVFDRMLALDHEKASWDLPTLGGLLPALAGHLVDLVENAPLAQNIAFFAREVVSASWARQAIRQVAELQGRIYRREPFTALDDILALAHDVTAGVLAGPGTRNGTPTPAELAIKLVNEYEAAVNQRASGKPAGLATGFRALNDAIGGFRPKALYVLGARTGMGKTTLALNMAQAASEAGGKVCLFTIEMADTQILAKLLSSTALIPHSDIVDATMSEEQESRFMMQVERYGQQWLSINEKDGRTIEAFEAECRRMRRAGNLDMAIIDYVQLMKVGSHNYQNRSQELSEISGRLKALALALDIPILALAQINREATKSQDKRPNIAQLKDSGALEQDADGIFLLHREDYYEEGDRTWLILAKNRYGAPGTLEIGADLTRNRFKDLHA